jgi:hypothetical protein
MAVIDTLATSRRLRAAGLTVEQADGIAMVLNDLLTDAQRKQGHPTTGTSNHEAVAQLKVSIRLVTYLTACALFMTFMVLLLVFQK